jgi:hypothetical protein
MHRIAQAILLVFALVALAGCASDRKGWHDHSLLRSMAYPEDTVAALNETANDQSASQEDRARAIFTLFGRYVRPGCSAADLHRVATNVGWLQGSKLCRVGYYTGWIPVDDPFQDTVFCLYLFSAPADKRAQYWHIYFRLAGENLQDEDALTFLKGSGGAGSTRRMPEFALCFPHSIFHPDRALGRIETFSPRGVRVREEEMAR